MIAAACGGGGGGAADGGGLFERIEYDEDQTGTFSSGADVIIAEASGDLPMNSMRIGDQVWMMALLQCWVRDVLRPATLELSTTQDHGQFTATPPVAVRISRVVE